MAELDASKRKMGQEADLCVLTIYKLVSSKMFGDFQSERLAVQAGETIGRDLAAGKDTKAVPKLLTDFITKSGLGSVKFEMPKEKVERYEPLGIFRVAESAETYGLAKVEKPCCGILRGIIRGAFAGAYHQENISVKEIKCAALGEKECVFEAYWVPM